MGLKCLIVDDVEVTRFSSTTFLNRLGVDVLSSKDATEAWAELDKNDVDIIILDWHLGRSSGLDLLKEIRGKYGNQHYILMLSGVEEESALAKAVEVGANDFMAKPTTFEKLQSVIQKFNGHQK